MELTAQHPYGNAARKAMDQRQAASAKASKACLAMLFGLDGGVLVILHIAHGILRVVAFCQQE